MIRRGARLSLPALAATLAACAIQPQNTVMNGGPDGVVISYYGDVNDTARLARQHCAQFERAPVLRATKENNAYYSCVRPTATPGAGA